jgi:MFS-type transporter involved in bile tolerance (Atg22 family)
MQLSISAAVSGLVGMILGFWAARMLDKIVPRKAWWKDLAGISIIVLVMFAWTVFLHWWLGERLLPL